MTPFLKEIAESIYARYRDGIGEAVLIFPNRRAGFYFRKYLAEYLDAPIWSPTIMSMEDFVGQYTSPVVADKFTLVIDLYHAYRKQVFGDEGFEKFYYWGEMLLKDFDDMDKYLLHPKHLFTNLSKQKELDDTFDFLTPEQQQIIVDFWSRFESQDSKEKAGFQSLWEKLYTIYQLFRATLQREGRAYTGMLYRELAEGLDRIEDCQRLIFAGFNALTTSEEAIITHCVENGAQVYWDVDAYYLDDIHQEAGVFFREYRSKNILGKTFDKQASEHIRTNASDREVTLNAASLNVGQVKMLGSQLAAHVRSPDFHPEKTVIVLPDEQLLFPVLNAIPETVRSLNVTMGFPLQSTPLHSLLSALLELQESAQVKEEELSFHFKPLLQVLEHPLISQYAPEEVELYISKIEHNNQARVTIEPTEEGELAGILFTKSDTVHELLEHLNSIIVTLFAGEKKGMDALEIEYGYQFYTQLNRIKEVFFNDDLKLSIATFTKLFHQIMAGHRMPFTGDPLQGLQVMGVLETRNLDFDDVYLLSANEGVLPVAGNQHSFIPYNIRKAYGLPTYDQQDAMYSYLFYRLIQRAKRVHIYYNTVEEEGGELSRFVQQFIMESGHKVVHHVWSPDATLDSAAPIIVEKTAKVLNSLGKYKVGDRPFKRLTPSALNIYLDCRLKFYYRYVAEIYEYDSIQTDIDPMVFGNILHQTMEQLYTPYRAKSITVEDRASIIDQLDDAIDGAFAAHYQQSRREKVLYEGKMIIARDVIKKYALKIVTMDMEYAPFLIVGLEDSDGYVLDLPITAEDTIGLKGIIDRIDEKDGLVRVIDYKTGQDSKVLTSVASLFDRNDEKRNKAVMQTFFYALLYANKYPEVSTIVPGIFNSKEMFSKEFDYHLRLQGAKPSQKTPIYNVTPFLKEFKSILTKLLQELYSPNVPFDQTDDLKKCRYCAYQQICGR